MTAEMLKKFQTCTGEWNNGLCGEDGVRFDSISEAAETMVVVAFDLGSSHEAAYCHGASDDIETADRMLKEILDLVIIKSGVDFIVD